MNTPKEQIRPDSEFRRIRHAVWQSWRKLAQDKEFVWETARLKLHLTLALGEHPKQIRLFFNPTFQPILYRANEIQRRVDRLADKHLQTALRRYIRYVSRFGVAMRLHRRAPYFRTIGLRGDPRNKFHVKVIGSHFEPNESYRDDGHTPVSEFLGSETVAVGRQMRTLINTGAAKYVQIENRQRHSLLNRLMEFAYSPDHLTFVMLSSEQLYVFCLIGENVSVDSTWRDAGKVVSEFQKHCYKRTRAGRPPQLRRLRKELAVLLRDKHTLKEKAIFLAKSETAKHVYSKMSALSQIMRKLAI